WYSVLRLLKKMFALVRSGLTVTPVSVTPLTRGSLTSRSSTSATAWRSNSLTRSGRREGIEISAQQSAFSNQLLVINVQYRLASWLYGPKLLSHQISTTGRKVRS